MAAQEAPAVELAQALAAEREPAEAPGQVAELVLAAALAAGWTWTSR